MRPRPRKLTIVLVLMFVGGTIYGDFRNLSVMAGPAVIGSYQKIDSTWGAFGPTVDFVFPLSGDEMAPTVGLRMDPLLILNTFQGKVGLIFHQNKRLSTIAELGGGVAFGFLGAVQAMPVFDSSVLFRQYLDEENDLEFVYGLRASVQVYPFQIGTIICLPLGIVF